MYFLRSVCFVVSCLGFTLGCATFSTPQTGKEVIKQGPIEIKFNPPVGRKEVVRYYTKSHSKTYEEGQIRHEKEEDMSFTSEIQTLLISNKKEVTVNVTVTEKDGLMNLHDMAFPELGESLHMQYTSDGKVLKAGGFPQNSIFYVPPVSYPGKAVQVGDTWLMTAEWVSMANSLPLKLDMVSILKKIVKCGEKECADIEISGDVNFANSIVGGPNFSSRLKGHMYVSLENGAIVWSLISSQERLIMGPAGEIIVESCLSSLLISPSEEKLQGVDKVKCDL